MGFQLEALEAERRCPACHGCPIPSSKSMFPEADSTKKPSTIGTRKSFTVPTMKPSLSWTRPSLPTKKPYGSANCVVVIPRPPIWVI